MNNFNNLPERKLSVNSKSSKHSSTGAGDCFGYFRNCFDCDFGLSIDRNQPLLVCK